MDCLPYRNLAHPWPSPNEDVTYDKIIDDGGIERTDFSHLAEEQVDIHPFEATHACCNPTTYTIYTREEEKECFRNPNEGCYGQYLDEEDDLVFLGSYQGIIWEEQRQLCDGERGNICNGLFANKLYNELLWCGKIGENQCTTRIETKCQEEPAFSYVDTNDDGRNDGWCYGTLGCTAFCPERKGIAYTDPIPSETLAYGRAGITELATAIFQRGIMDIETELPFQCGCSPDVNGHPCDGNYDGWFNEVCEGDACRVRLPGSQGDKRCSEDYRRVEQLNELQTAWLPVGDDCQPDEYCGYRERQPQCLPVECNPAADDKPRCYNSIPSTTAQERIRLGSGEDAAFLPGLVVKCEEPGRYEDLAWFVGGQEEAPVPVECGSAGYDVLVNEGTRDSQEWVGRGCTDTDEENQRDCLKYEGGEWKDGECAPDPDRRDSFICDIS